MSCYLNTVLNAFLSLKPLSVSYCGQCTQLQTEYCVSIRSNEGNSGQMSRSLDNCRSVFYRFGKQQDMYEALLLFLDILHTLTIEDQCKDSSLLKQ